MSNTLTSEEQPELFEPAVGIRVVSPVVDGLVQARQVLRNAGEGEAVRGSSGLQAPALAEQVAQLARFTARLAGPVGRHAARHPVPAPACRYAPRPRHLPILAAKSR